LTNLGLLENSHDAEIPPTLVSEVLNRFSMPGEVQFEVLRDDVACSVATRSSIM
jgi:hypothetical protein